MAKPLVAEIESRLKEIDEERNHLIALVTLYKSAPVVVTQGNGKAPRPFQPLAGGPTERIKTVLRLEGGLTYGEIMARAIVGMNTEAGSPERSLASTLQSLVKRGVVERRDKKHWLAGEESHR